MTDHDQYCDREHNPRQQCNFALAPAAPPPPKPGEFDVELILAPNKANAVKAIRDLTQLSQADATVLAFAQPPVTILTRVDRESAEAAKDLLVAARVVVEVRPAAEEKVRPWHSTSHQQIVEYENNSAFQNERENWIANGWKVANVTEITQRKGCLRFILLSWLALIFSPPSHVLVVYERARASLAADPGVTVGGASPSVALMPNRDLADELQRLAALRDSGVITDDEFDVAKRRVLGTD